MGYETKMYLCEITDRKIKDRLPYAMVVSMIDLCKMGEGLPDAVRKTALKNQKGKEVCYFYADDRDTEIKRDYYDDPLVIIDPAEFLEALETEIQKDIETGVEPYRRFIMAVAMLKVTIEEFGDNLKVVTFGY